MMVLPGRLERARGAGVTLPLPDPRGGIDSDVSQEDFVQTYGL